MLCFYPFQAKNGVNPSTLGRRTAAIKYLHEAKNYDSPTKSKLVSAILGGIRRVHGIPPVRKSPLTVNKMLMLLAQVPNNTVKGIRDRDILLIGFNVALRRSELVDLCVEDRDEVHEGLNIIIRKSKTDQESKGQQIAIPREVTASEYCVTALNKWFDVSGIKHGSVFRSVSKWNHVGLAMIRPKSVCLIIKQYTKLAGLNPDEFGGHSLRSGWITSAAEKKGGGASIFKLKEVSRHRSLNILSDYVRKFIERITSLWQKEFPKIISEYQ